MRPHTCTLVISLLGILILPATVCAGQAAGDSLTVADVVRIAVGRHPAITQAAEQVSAANARVKQAESGWYPMIGAEAGYTRLAPIATIQFGPEELRLFPADNYDAHVGVRQQIYDFGKTSASTDLNRSRLQSARVGVDLSRTGVAYQAIQVFYSILYLREAVAVQEEQITALREHIDATKKRVASGSATDFDVLTTQVRVAAAENQRIDLQNAEHKAEIMLARLMGREGEETLPLSGTFERRPVPVDVDSLVVVASRRRPEILAAVSEEQTAQVQVRIANVADNPSLNLGVSYGVKNGYMPNLDVLRGNLAASVRLEVPIFEGGRAGHREEEAGATLRAAQARMADLRSQVTQEVRQGMSDLRSAAGKLAATELQVTQAHDALTIARKRYESGTISNLDLLDSETAIEQAGLLRLQALYAYTTSRYALDRAVGLEPMP